jgi:hypothetical protein
VITLQVFREQNQMKVSLFAGAGGARTILTTPASDVDFTADERLDAFRFHLIIKRDGPKHVAMIRHGAGFHSQFRGTLGQRLNLYRAIQQAVIRV